MSVEITYDFLYDGYPYIYMVTNFDGQELSRVSINIEQEYKIIPTEALNMFSEFLLNEFKLKIDKLILEDKINYTKFNDVVDSLKVISRIKTGCDEVIYNRENPPEQDQHFSPPLEG